MLRIERQNFQMKSEKLFRSGAQCAPLQSYLQDCLQLFISVRENSKNLLTYIRRNGKIYTACKSARNIENTRR